MELLYYAIISVCLSVGGCSKTEDFDKYIYMNAVPFEQCLTVVEQMVMEKRKSNPDLLHRPFSTLCVQEGALTDEDKSKYTIWGTTL